MSLPIRTVDFKQSVVSQAVTANSVETQLMVSPTVTILDGASGVIIQCFAGFFSPTATTAWTLICRRGTGLTGAQLIAGTVGGGSGGWRSAANPASAEVTLCGLWIDQVSALGSNTWTISGKYSANDANGVCEALSLMVLVF